MCHPEAHRSITILEKTPSKSFYLVGIVGNLYRTRKSAEGPRKLGVWEKALQQGLESSWESSRGSQLTMLALGEEKLQSSTACRGLPQLIGPRWDCST